MKVLSNLLGNDTKINANTIAYKDGNNNPRTLDEHLTTTSLYKNTIGSASNLTLSDDIENYKEYQIVYSRGGYGYHISSRIPTDYLTDISLITSFYSGSILRFYVSNISLSGTTLTRNYSRYLNVTDNSNAVNTSNEVSVYIHEVIAYK